VVEHGYGAELSHALDCGLGEVLGADALTVAVNLGLCRCALPLGAAVTIALGADHDLESVLVGLGRAARALGVALERVTHSPGGPSIHVALGVRLPREPAPARAGDVPFLLPANGPPEARRQILCAGFDELSAAERAERLRVAFAPQRSYLSLLHRPVSEGWYRGAALVADGDVGSTAASLAPGATWDAGAPPSAGAQPPGLVVLVAGDRCDTFADHVAAWGETTWALTPDLATRST
jgi:hypothetical protein